MPASRLANWSTSPAASSARTGLALPQIRMSPPSRPRSAAMSLIASSGESNVVLFQVRASGVSVVEATYFLMAFI